MIKFGFVLFLLLLVLIEPAKAEDYIIPVQFEIKLIDGWTNQPMPDNHIHLTISGLLPTYEVDATTDSSGIYRSVAEGRSVIKVSEYSGCDPDTSFLLPNSYPPPGVSLSVYSQICFVQLPIVHK